MSIHLTTAGLDQLLRDLKEQGYQGTRQYLEHLVLRASTTSGMGLLHAGLEQLVLEKRFEADSLESFRQVMDFWAKRFLYATVRLDHSYRFDILFWKPVDAQQIQESARFYLSMATGDGEIFMKLRDQLKPERRSLRLEPAKQVLKSGQPAAQADVPLERPARASVPAAWAAALMDDIPSEPVAENEDMPPPIDEMQPDSLH